MEKYYYNRLNKAQQNTYHAMKTGLESLVPSFQIPRLEAKELMDVYFLLRLDCPEIFYSVKYSYRYYPSSGNAEMIPEYLFEKSKVKEHQKAMKARVEKLVRPAMKMSEMEKVQYVHDFICQNVYYDKLKKPYSHEIIGPLGQGVGVCEGIAKSVKILLDALGVWCIIAISEANPEKGIKYRHAWNVVRVNGQYYHLDATFDNTLGNQVNGAGRNAEGNQRSGQKCSASGRSDEQKMIRYDYFNLCDKQIFRDHEPVIWKVPSCTDGDHFYYKEKKLSFTKMEDVRKRSAQAVKKGKVLLFHWRGGYLTREIVMEMFHIFEEEAIKKEKHARVSLNWPQSVLRVEFIDEIPQEQMKLEEANEGESICAAD